MSFAKEIAGSYYFTGPLPPVVPHWEEIGGKARGFLKLFEDGGVIYSDQSDRGLFTVLESPGFGSWKEARPQPEPSKSRMLTATIVVLMFDQEGIPKRLSRWLLALEFPSRRADTFEARCFREKLALDEDPTKPFQKLELLGTVKGKRIEAMEDASRVLETASSDTLETQQPKDVLVK